MLLKIRQLIDQLTATLALLRGLLLALKALHLGSTFGSSLPLSPGQPTILALIGLGGDAGLLSSATNLPVRLPVHVSRTQRGASGGIGGHHAGDHRALFNSCKQI